MNKTRENLKSHDEDESSQVDTNSTSDMSPNSESNNSSSMDNSAGTVPDEEVKNESSAVRAEENSKDFDVEILNYPSSSEEDNEKDEVPFNELLEIHCKQLVWGFKYGEENRRLAERNMKISTSETTDEVDPQPSCSKASVPSESDHKTPHSAKRQQVTGVKRPLGKSDDANMIEVRRVPVPLRQCLDNIDCWKFMVSREEATINSRNSRLFYDFKIVTPRMRAILLDWLMEVAEVYHLKRVTYFSAVDYFDRFLTIRPAVPKSALQLVGITCLYVAAKLEEIYPPNLKEFAYVCDGACRAQDIIACELLVLNSLGWEANVTTVSDWLNVYLQILNNYENFLKTPQMSLKQSVQNFMFPQYSACQYIQASQLVDLFSLDPSFLKYRYSTVAAAALYFLYGKEITYIISGIPWEELRPCVEYMAVFYKILKEADDPRLISVPNGRPNSVDDTFAGIAVQANNGNVNDSYQLQTHVANMQYFEQACILRLAILTGRYEKVHNANIEYDNINDTSPTKKCCKDHHPQTSTAETGERKNDKDATKFCKTLANSELELINKALENRNNNNGSGETSAGQVNQQTAGESDDDSNEGLTIDNILDLILTHQNGGEE